MPRSPVVFIDEALLPAARHTTSSVKPWRLKAVDAKVPKMSEAQGQRAFFTSTRGSMARTFTVASQLGVKWTYLDASQPECDHVCTTRNCWCHGVIKDAYLQDTDPQPALPAIEPAALCDQSADADTADDPTPEAAEAEAEVEELQELPLPKANRRKKKIATMPARVGPKEEMASARLEGIGQIARGRVMSEARLPKLQVPEPLQSGSVLTAAGVPDLPVVMRKKKKIVSMPELRRFLVQG
ncbi:unnamed protein product [Effrenium voratum]|nr:unnamed protein product [Effrenium voratum]